MRSRLGGWPRAAGQNGLRPASPIFTLDNDLTKPLWTTRAAARAVAATRDAARADPVLHGLGRRVPHAGPTRRDPVMPDRRDAKATVNRQSWPDRRRGAPWPSVGARPYEMFDAVRCGFEVQHAKSIRPSKPLDTRRTADSDAGPPAPPRPVSYIRSRSHPAERLACGQFFDLDQTRALPSMVDKLSVLGKNG